MLVHLIEVGPETEPERAYATVRGELSAYGGGLADLPELVVLSKRDLVTDEAADELVEQVRGAVGEPGRPVLTASSASGAGLDELRTAIFAAAPDAFVPPIPATEHRFEAEHITYRPAADQGFDVVSEGEGVFRVSGRGIELLFARHDISNLEALAYLEQRLREIGVIAALQAAGFEPGDEVRVGSKEFELHP